MLIVLDLKVDGLGPHLAKLLPNYNVTDRVRHTIQVQRFIFKVNR